MSLHDAEQALGNLEELVRRNASPGPHLARHVLLTLGRALEEAPEACGPLIARAHAAGRTAGESWGQAVQTELTLACGEFLQSVDPRYLGLANYDLEYTRGSRARLADRLRAAKELGLELATREADLLELADRVLASHIARPGGTQPDSPTAPGPADRARDNRGRK